MADENPFVPLTAFHYFHNVDRRRDDIAAVVRGRGIHGFLIVNVT